MAILAMEQRNILQSPDLTTLFVLFYHVVKLPTPNGIRIEERKTNVTLNKKGSVFNFANSSSAGYILPFKPFWDGIHFSPDIMLTY